MLRAIIFDLDGVLARSEPGHLAVLQRALGGIGIFLPRDEYLACYLGRDDRACIPAILAERGRAAGPAEIEDPIRETGRAFSELIQQGAVIHAGVRELVRDAAVRCRLAVATTHRPGELDQADWAVPSLRGLTLSTIVDRLWSVP